MYAKCLEVCLTLHKYLLNEYTLSMANQCVEEAQLLTEGELKGKEGPTLC